MGLVPSLSVVVRGGRGAFLTARAGALLLCSLSAAACSDPASAPAGTGTADEPAKTSHDAGKRADARSADPSADTDPKETVQRADGGVHADAKVAAPQPDASAPSDAGPAPTDASLSVADAGLTHYAAMLDALFIDVPCDKATPTPLAKMATCLHPGTTQHIDRSVMFGGEPGAAYDVKLRVRGIWEPTSIQGGKRPYGKLPFTVGGSVTGGAGSSNDAVNYQQYFIKVSDPAQTYWLNDYQYVAHDIHKEDYEATLRIAAGAQVTVTMNDGNDHEIANWTKDFFMGLPPYGDAPSTGQSLRLDVLAVTPASPTP